MRDRRRFSHTNTKRITMNPHAPIAIRIIVIKSGNRSDTVSTVRTEIARMYPYNEVRISI